MRGPSYSDFRENPEDYDNEVGKYEEYCDMERERIRDNQAKENQNKEQDDTDTTRH